MNRNHLNLDDDKEFKLHQFVGGVALIFILAICGLVCFAAVHIIGGQ